MGDVGFKDRSQRNMGNPNRNAVKLAIPLLVLLWGLYSVPLRSMGVKLSHIPGDLGDARFNNYVLEHGYRYLRGYEPSFWNAPFFYPELNTIAFSDNHIGSLPVYSAFRLAGLDRESAFQGWIIASFILNFAACVYVFRKLGYGWAGSSAGAYLFAFGLPVIEKLHHAQLIPRFFIPFIFYHLWNYIRNPRQKYLIYTSLLTVLQFYVSKYNGWFAVLSGSAFFIMGKMAVNLPSPPRIKKQASWFLSCSAMAVLLLIPLALPYMRVMEELGGRSWEEIYSVLPMAESFLYPVRGSLLWDWMRGGKSFPLWWEHCLFTGVLPWTGGVLAFISYFARKRKKGKLEFVCAASILLTIVIISRMSIRGVYIYRVLSNIPGVAAIRVVTRIMLVLLLPFSILVCSLFEKLKAISPARLKASALALLMAVVLADQGLSPVFTNLRTPRHSFSKAYARERSDNIKRRLLENAQTPEVFVYMPAGNGSPFWVIHIDAMLASQDAGIPTVNGYSGQHPAHYDLWTNFGDICALDRWITYSNRKWSGVDRVSPQTEHEDLFKNILIIGDPAVAGGGCGSPEE